MKILMVSMSSIHFFRWTQQLEGSGHEVFWIDVFDSNKRSSQIKFAEQILGWRNKIDFPGRYWVKKNLPQISSFINVFNQRELAEIVSEKIKEFKPDLIHSFILQSGTFPLIEVMKKHPEIKWAYSAWGNDLYFRKQNELDFNRIKLTLPELDFMFADCTRDYIMARENGFRGQYLGTFPTGGGYEIREYEKLIYSFKKKDCIAIKGYQGKLGRCNIVLRAISKLKVELQNYRIIVFGANNDVLLFAEHLGLTKWENFKIKFMVNHQEVLKLLGSAKFYIGNSISDGLPNTLLEAIIMDAYPIQSNPGGATSELIADNENGSIIHDPEKPDEIVKILSKILQCDEVVVKAIEHNSRYIKPFLEREYIKEKVLIQYNFMEKKIHSNDNLT